MTSTHQPSRLTLDQPEDIIRFAISKEFLSPLERVMFASSMAPLNDASNTSNNQHISYLSKQLIMDSKTKLVSLDLTELGDCVLARMTDVDLYRILRCVHLYVHTFRLGNCIKVQGWGLAPLKHSSKLRNMDMSKIASGKCQLQEEMTLPILLSIINTFGNSFRVVQFPVDWRAKGKENKLLRIFLLAFDEKLCDRHLHCYECDYCIHSDESDMYAAKDELKYFCEGKDTYGLQQNVCYECSDVACDDGNGDCWLDRCKVCRTVACSEKCSNMRYCEPCSEEYCTSCRNVLDCINCDTPSCRDCCIDEICSYCGKLDCCEGTFKCSECGVRSCDECFEVRYCVRCDSGHCMECIPTLRCDACHEPSCRNCCIDEICSYCGKLDCCEGTFKCSECGVKSCDDCDEVRYCERCDSAHCMECNPTWRCDECHEPSCMVDVCSDCGKKTCTSCSVWCDQCEPEDIIRFAISKEFLSPLERIMFASSMAPLNDAHDASNNQHISYLSKQIIMDSKTKLVSLDLTALGDALLARMTDVDIYRILRCVHLYVHTFRLGNCTKVQGWGLAPLKHSTKLRNMDMSKIAIGKCQLQEKMTLPILHSIINTFGNKLQVVQFPVDWRAKGKENKLLHRFLLAFDETLNSRHLHCHECDYCIHSDEDECDMYPAKDGLKYFGEGKDTYGLQQYVCYECSEITCDFDGCYLDKCKVCQTVACQEKCSKMRWCEGCGEDYCTSCEDVLECTNCDIQLCRECCRDEICSFCGNLDCCEGTFCSECGGRSCGECFEVRWCDECDSGHCMECIPTWGCDECHDFSCRVALCSGCDKASCRSCSKVLPCMSPRCDDFHCYECLTSNCSDGAMGLMVNHALSALMESLSLEVQGGDSSDAVGSEEAEGTDANGYDV
ncbi:hypothetical protein CTEN210_10171 [Chaetoceros tenuissimus]|uniref:Uncharacterized protein n=1 Tax=Chaetoceros tenuissimus TaxID=426638 RepID=A0AAD3CZC2_9STRA|nr:hypothetical protein CTEN210_10171 [Chaetoceros tenuissimus]